jgi:hypothetical protein
MLIDHGPHDYWEVYQSHRGKPYGLIAHSYEAFDGRDINTWNALAQPIGRGLEGPHYEEAYANAKLITAAPDLYEICVKAAEAGIAGAKELLERIEK